MSLQEVYDMSWAEFVLRSIGFQEEREFMATMVREVSYEAHSMRYIFSKKSPPKKEVYWPIGKKKKATKAHVPESFLKAREEYLKQKNGG
jgi:hypothetical protein